MIALGSPVVPDEYSTHSGWSNGTSTNSGWPSPAAAGRSAQLSVRTPARPAAARVAGPSLGDAAPGDPAPRAAASGSAASLAPASSAAAAAAGLSTMITAA